MSIAVLRNTITGICYLTAGEDGGFDTERLAEGDLEVAGWLRRPEQYDAKASAKIGCWCEDGEGEDGLPCFTECERDGCQRLLLIVDGGAPEFCSEHEQAARYRFLRDGGHGWLEVPRAEVVTSGADISRYSYFDPKTDMAYLEEDCDALAFEKAAGLYGRRYPTEAVESSMPRRLPSYNPDVFPQLRVRSGE